MVIECIKIPLAARWLFSWHGRFWFENLSKISGKGLFHQIIFVVKNTISFSGGYSITSNAGSPMPLFLCWIPNIDPNVSDTSNIEINFWSPCAELHLLTESLQWIKRNSFFRIMDPKYWIFLFLLFTDPKYWSNIKFRTPNFGTYSPVLKLMSTPFGQFSTFHQTWDKFFGTLCTKEDVFYRMLGLLLLRDLDTQIFSV